MEFLPLTEIRARVERDAPLQMSPADSELFWDTLSALNKETGSQATFAVLSNAQIVSNVECPRGFAICMPATTTLSKLSTLDLLKQRLVSSMCVTKIGAPLADLPNATLLAAQQQTPAYYKERAAAISAAVPQYSIAPPRLAVWDTSTNRDSAHWEAELGAHGIAGVYRAPRPLGLANEYDYYLVARCSAEVAKNDFYVQHRDATTPTTFGALVKSAEYKALLSLTRRNAQRVVARMADALHVEVRTTPDRLSVFAGQPGFVAPDLAVPDMLHETHGLVSRNRGLQVVASCAASHIAASQTHAIVPLTPSEGFAAFPVATTARDEQGALWPAGMARVMPHAEAERVAASEPAFCPSDLYVMPKEAQARRTMRGQILPQAYAKPNHEFFAQCEERGWVASQHRIRLQPVIAKAGLSHAQHHTARPTPASVESLTPATIVATA